MADQAPVISPPLSITPPAKLDLDCSDLPKVWKRWKEELELYLDLAMDGKTNAIKTKMVKYLLGYTGRELYDTFTFTTDEDARTVKEILDKFDSHCDPKKNETVERYKFFSRKQEVGESIEKYTTELKVLAKSCNFDTLHDSLVKDRIVCGITDSQLRERLLRETDLNLEKCIRTCRAYELSKEQIKTLDEGVLTAANDAVVHKVQRRPSSGRKQTSTGTPGKAKLAHKQRDARPKEFKSKTVSCKYCGNTHERSRDVCPAFGKTCSNCLRDGHFAKLCKNKKIHQLDAQESDSDDYYSIHTVTLSDNVNAVSNKSQGQIFATMLIDMKPVKFQVDSGASCNVIPVHLLDESYKLKKTSQVLTMYNQAKVNPMGTCFVKMTNPKDGVKYKVPFVVLEGNHTPLLGSKTAQQMRLIKINYENILRVQSSTPLSMKELSTEYNDVFTGTGLLSGSYHLVVDDSIQPVVHRPRRIPVSLRDKLKEELERLTNLGIITPVSQPTPWVSSLVLVEKGKKLRIRIDPKDLNRTI